MDLNALDPGKMIVLMVFGGLFAMAGLWMILRPKPEGSKAKIELFGLKFESSSAGILVFLIGTAFLAIPIFVDERPAEALATSGGGGTTSAATTAAGAAEAGENAVQEGAPETVAIAVTEGGPIRVEGEEVEPNNSIPRANIVPLGASVAGDHANATLDFYRIEVPEGTTGDISINVNGSSLRTQVFNQFGEMIHNNYFGGPGSETFRGAASEPIYIVRIETGRGDRGGPGYFLTVAARPAE